MKKKLLFLITGLFLILSGCEKDLDLIHSESENYSNTNVQISKRYSAEVQTAIDNGIIWLEAQQNPDGSFYVECVPPDPNNPDCPDDKTGRTALAVKKLCDYAIESDEIPMDNEQIRMGLAYLFANTRDLDGRGLYITDLGTQHHEAYNTGLAMMAIAAAKSPGTTTYLPGFTDPISYKHILQECVRYFESTQYADGGWHYTDATLGESDNSNTGFAVLGLLAAQSAGCEIPEGLMNLLESFITNIQDPVSGGSKYQVDGDPELYVNLLKTGNLLFELAFTGNGMEDSRTINAIRYIQKNWNEESGEGQATPGWKTDNYLAMYCMMKGFVTMEIDTITVDGQRINWYDEFVEDILADGGWPLSIGPWTDPYLSSVFGLLVLEKATPELFDSDDDGCNNLIDKHSFSIQDEYISVDECITEIPNSLLNCGSFMMDFLNDCAINAINHGDYVSCVAHLTNEWKTAGLISGQEKGIIQRCAAQSDIPD